jgi:hypothetical protein
MSKWKPAEGAVAPSRAAIENAVQGWARSRKNVLKAWLLGSRITGTSHDSGEPFRPDSDWDVAIQLDGPTGEERKSRWFKMISSAQDQLEELTGWRVHVGDCDFAFYPDAPTAEAVTAHGVLIYDRENEPEVRPEEVLTKLRSLEKRGSIQLSLEKKSEERHGCRPFRSDQS